MWKHFLTLAAAAGLFVATSATASAAVIIFDDANGEGWSRVWNLTTQTTHVYEGTTALQNADNGQFTFTHAGFVDANHHILEFYVNTTDATPATSLFIEMSWVDADSTVHANIPFSTRNVPAVYVIDGVPVAAGSSINGIALDTDTSTWQRIQFDLTQTAYTGWPYEAHNYVPGSSSLTLIRLRNEGGQSLNVVMDSVRLIPEPASLGLIGAGALMLLGRRRMRRGTILE